MELRFETTVLICALITLCLFGTLVGIGFYAGKTMEMQRTVSNSLNVEKYCSAQMDDTHHFDITCSKEIDSFIHYSPQGKPVLVTIPIITDEN